MSQAQTNSTLHIIDQRPSEAFGLAEHEFTSVRTLIVKDLARQAEAYAEKLVRQFRRDHPKLCTRLGISSDADILAYMVGLGLKISQHFDPDTNIISLVAYAPDFPPE